MESNVELLIESREKDLGGLMVRRILPYATHRMVGPFIFFDHMGPARFAPSQGMDVRPHPHIHLATVTYLFEGAILHRDSLGSEQLIEPGAINWMTAGKGIVHSERTPYELRATGSTLNGIQCWIALPQELEESAPSFAHHPATSIPEFENSGVSLRLLLGSAFGIESAVRTYSDIYYIEARFPAGSRLTVPGGNRENAVYLVEGAVGIEGQDVPEATMAVGKDGADLRIEAVRESRVMLLGGQPLEGRRYIWWNFVSSSRDAIEQAKEDWRAGPRASSERFLPIPGDDQEFIPLPEGLGLPANPKGTIM